MLTVMFQHSEIISKYISARILNGQNIIKLLEGIIENNDCLLVCKSDNHLQDDRWISSGFD